MSQKSNRRLWAGIGTGSGLLAALIVVVLLHTLLPIHPAPLSSDFPPTSIPLPPPVILADNPIDFTALRKEAPDTVGWIRVPGTVIDYPVMRSSEGKKEDFYLHHDTDGSYKFAGSIYMQRVNIPDFSDPTTLLYGHNMRNGSMFAALHKFKRQSFFEEHDTLYIYTPGHILTYRIYSIFVYDDRLIPRAFDFTKEEDITAYQQMTLDPDSYTRQVREGVTLTPTDRLVTLSTCTSREEERLLLHAVLVEDTLTK